MIDRPKKQFFNTSLLLALFFYSSISITISLFHNENEDPLTFHDDCPACMWERLSQDPSQATTALQLCEQTYQIFIYYISIEQAQSNFQQIHFSDLLTRAPPLA